MLQTADCEPPLALPTTPRILHRNHRAHLLLRLGKLRLQLLGACVAARSRLLRAGVLVTGRAAAAGCCCCAGVRLAVAAALGISGEPAA